MAFALTFTTDNAAFDADHGGEAARILRHIADRMDAGAISGRAVDENGNTVGDWHLSNMQPDVREPAAADILAAALS